MGLKNNSPPQFKIYFLLSDVESSVLGLFRCSAKWHLLSDLQNYLSSLWCQESLFGVSYFSSLIWSWTCSWQSEWEKVWMQFVLVCVWVLVKLGGGNKIWTSNWTGGGWWQAAWWHLVCSGDCYCACARVCLRVCVCLRRVSDWIWQRPLYCWLARRFSRPVLDTLIWIKCSSVSVGTRSEATPSLCPFTCFHHPPAHLEQHPPPPHTPHPFALLSSLKAFSFPSTSRAEHTPQSGRIFASLGVRLCEDCIGGKGSQRGLNPLSPFPHLLQRVSAFGSVILEMFLNSNSVIPCKKESFL